MARVLTADTGFALLFNATSELRRHLQAGALNVVRADEVVGQRGASYQRSENSVMVTTGQQPGRLVASSPSCCSQPG